MLIYFYVEIVLMLRMFGELEKLFGVTKLSSSITNASYNVMDDYDNQNWVMNFLIMGKVGVD